MFKSLSDTIWDIKYVGLKYAISENIDYVKNNPGKAAAQVTVDVAAKMIPGGTLVKSVGKAVGKSVIKNAIRKDSK